MPFVPIPVDGVRDHERIPSSDVHNKFDDVEMMSGGEGEDHQSGNKRRRCDSTEGSSSSEYIEFSGSDDGAVVVDEGAVAPVPPKQQAAPGISPQPAVQAGPQHQAGRLPQQHQAIQQPPQPTRRSQRQRRPKIRFNPNNWVITTSIMQCMLVGMVNELLNPKQCRRL